MFSWTSWKKDAAGLVHLFLGLNWKQWQQVRYDGDQYGAPKETWA